MIILMLAADQHDLIVKGLTCHAAIQFQKNDVLLLRAEQLKCCDSKYLDKMRYSVNILA